MSEMAGASSNLGGMIFRHAQENWWHHSLAVIGPTDGGKSEFTGKILVPGHVARSYPKTIRVGVKERGRVTVYKPGIGRSRRSFKFRDVPGDGWDPRDPKQVPQGKKVRWGFGNNGDKNWWPVWFDIILEGPASYIIFIFDPRNMEVSAKAAKFFAEHLADGKYPGSKFWNRIKMMGLFDTYTPNKVVFWANFCDEWSNEAELLRMQDETFYEPIWCPECELSNCNHKGKRDLHWVFRPLKESIAYLEKAEVETMLWAGSAATMTNMREGLLKMVIG